MVNLSFGIDYSLLVKKQNQQETVSMPVNQRQLFVWIYLKHRIWCYCQITTISVDTSTDIQRVLTVKYFLTRGQSYFAAGGNFHFGARGNFVPANSSIPKNSPKWLRLECTLCYQLKRFGIIPIPRQVIRDILDFNTEQALELDELLASHKVDLPSDIVAHIQQNTSYVFPTSASGSYVFDASTQRIYQGTSLTQVKTLPAN